MYRQGTNILVTTSLRAGSGQVTLAHRLSDETGLPRVARDDRPLAELLQIYGAAGAVVVESGRVVCSDGEREFFFHPGLACLRINELRKGKNDQMVAAMDLKPGQKVLDCTLGLGNDAIVASHVTGASGLVVGLEYSPVIAALVRHGTRTYGKAGRAVLEAMRRVVVENADHRVVLAALPPRSFDVVYLDPMFSRPLSKSSGINALRPLADHRPLTTEVVELALRVADKRVVVKENKEENRLPGLGFTRFAGGKNSRAVFGVLVN
ncbi:MAG: class I SAM-dependent methyltransferase [Firmicutes bacterium]|nr:class I SAM-dependent methyltransferase [Bacillota bacterium]